MVYSNYNSFKKVNVFTRVIYRFSKIIVKSFPLNRVRKLGVKLCGYKIGKNVYIGEEFLIINAISEKSTHLEIQDRVAIAPRVTVVLASDANWSRLTETRKPIRGKIILKKDCWIGTGAIILPNITIAESAIVAAGSVVTRDVMDYTVVAGNPAIKIKDLE